MYVIFAGRNMSNTEVKFSVLSCEEYRPNHPEDMWLYNPNLRMDVSDYIGGLWYTDVLEPKFKAGNEFVISCPRLNSNHEYQQFEASFNLHVLDEAVRRFDNIENFLNLLKGAVEHIGIKYNLKENGHYFHDFQSSQSTYFIHSSHVILKFKSSMYDTTIVSELCKRALVAVSDYQNYHAQCLAQLKKAFTITLSDKYEIIQSVDGEAKVSATSYPGLTVLAKPVPIEGITRTQLEDLQRQFAADNGFIPVPQATLHMTIADLASGRTFRPDQVKQIQTAVQDVFTGWNSNNEVIKGKVLGLSTFPGCVIAVVDFVNIHGYLHIIDLRERIYRHSTLAPFQPTYSFQGHITLGYLVDHPKQLEAIVRNNSDPDGYGYEFEMKGAGLYSFENMSEYSLVDNLAISF